jgi:hypothetical protein
MTKQSVNETSIGRTHLPKTLGYKTKSQRIDQQRIGFNVPNLALNQNLNFRLLKSIPENH